MIPVSRRHGQTRRRDLLRANVGSGRRILGRQLKGRLIFTRRVEGLREFYEFSGEGTIRPILEGIVDDSITTCGVPNGIARYVRTRNRRHVRVAARRDSSEGSVT